MLEIKNLHAVVDGREILRDQLTVNPGEVHAIMGPMLGQIHALQRAAGREG